VPVLSDAEWAAADDVASDVFAESSE